MSAFYKIINKNGSEVGWGEGSTSAFIEHIKDEYLEIEEQKYNWNEKKGRWEE